MKKMYLLFALIVLVAAGALALTIPKILPAQDPPHTTISALPPEAREYNPAIATMIADVSESEIFNTTFALQNFSTRRARTPENRQASQYLYNRLAAIPGLTVEYQGAGSQNVIATLPGRQETPGMTFIVGAHYDSIAAGEYAPGATDNGCGTAIVLELARVMSGHQFNHTILFAFWDSEELEPMGSEDFVRQAARESRDIPLYYNFDAACYDPENRFVLDVQSNNGSAAAVDLLTRDNSLYGIGFNLTYGVFDCISDYLVFDQYGGYPGIATHSSSHGPGHTADDTVAVISPGYARKNAQLGAAVLAGVAEIRK